MPIGSSIISYDHRSYALGIDIPLLIFPTLLQKQIHFREVLSFHICDTAKARCTDTLLAVGHLYFIIKLYGDRFLCKRYAGIQHFLRIFGSLDRFVHLTQKHRAGSQHRDIYYSKNLHTLHTGVHAGAETIPSLFRKNRSISFRDTGYPGHHIGCRPRRTSHILVCLGFGDSSSRADGIHILRGTANNTGFLDLAVNPLIHISERNHLYLVLLRRNGSATKHGRQHSQHTNFLLNHFSH